MLFYSVSGLNLIQRKEGTVFREMEHTQEKTKSPKTKEVYGTVCNTINTVCLERLKQTAVYNRPYEKDTF